MVNSFWATDAFILNTHCTPALELLTIKVKPFYLPREFSSVILTVVYIPPQAAKTQALGELYEIINGLENTHPDAAFIVLGDFNRANMIGTKFYQHISLPTKGEQILNHCYTPFKDSYKPFLHPAFDKADHSAILLLPAHKQRLKQEKLFRKNIYKWYNVADVALQDCFETTDWQMFAHSMHH